MSAGTHAQSIVVAALDYARLGLLVLPLHGIREASGGVGCTCHDAAQCHSPGKHPRFRDWVKRATAEDRIIRDTFPRYPESNIGILTGEASDLLVLDIDPGNGGAETLLELEARHGPLPPTWEASTGGGGRHLIFRYPRGVRVGNTQGNGRGRKLGRGVDVRGEGGQIVAPPSLHRSGRRYEWVNVPGGPVPKADLPTWALELLTDSPSIPGDAGPSASGSKPPRDEEIDDPYAYAATALAGELQAVREAAEGDRNNTLYSATYRAGQLVAAGAVKPEPARQLLAKAGLDSGLDMAEITKTVNSGLERGLAHPDERLRSSVEANASPKASAGGRGNPPRRGEVAKGTDEKPVIQSNRRQLWETTEDALRALERSNRPPRLFQRDGVLVRLRNAPGERVIEPLAQDGLRGELARAAEWVRVDAKWNEEPCSPPTEVVRDLMAQAKYQSFPVLRAVVTCPCAAPDGTLILEPGYHPGAEVWHEPTLDGPVEVPAAPDDRQVREAVAVLLEPLLDFPFQDEASRANALGLMLLALVRPMIDGPTPLFAFDAPTPGTGKGLLVKALLLPALGRAPGSTTASRDPDEWRKKITAVLDAGAACVVFDNINSEVDSEHLAAVLTEAQWTDRALGQTKVLRLPNRTLWAATGNNLQFSKEIARRVVWVRLNAKQESPELRTGFRHPDLLAHVRSARTRLVTAALTLCRAWVARGRPPGPATMGSFEAFARTVGGILGVAGVPGFLANAGELRRLADRETQEWRAFVSAWWSGFGDAWVGTAELAGLLLEPPAAGSTARPARSDLLATVVRAHNDQGMRTALGKQISKKRDNVIGGYRLLISEHKDNKNRQTYRLVRHEGRSLECGPSPVAPANGEVVGREAAKPGTEGVADFCRVPRDSPGPPAAPAPPDATHSEATSGPNPSPGNFSAEVGTPSQPAVSPVDVTADMAADYWAAFDDGMADPGPPEDEDPITA